MTVQTLSHDKRAERWAMPAGTVFLLNDTSSTGHPGCVYVVQTIERQLAARGIGLTGRWPVAVDCRLATALHAGARRASAFIVNGEGTIHHTANRPKARNLLQFARAIKQRTGRPVFLINASVEALETEDFDLLRSFDRIFVRERWSRRYLSAHAVATDWAPDLSLASDVPAFRGRNGILCTDSAMPAANPLLRRCGAILGGRFMPMRPGRLLSCWRYVRSDRRALMSFAARYYEAIATARGVVTGRFHAMLFCLLAGTPFVALTSNTRKIESVLHDVFGSQRRRFGVTAPAGAGGIRISPFTDEEETLRLRYIRTAHQRANAMFDAIAVAVYGTQARSCASTAPTQSSASTGTAPTTEFRSTT